MARKRLFVQDHTGHSKAETSSLQQSQEQCVQHIDTIRLGLLGFMTFIKHKNDVWLHVAC